MLSLSIKTNFMSRKVFLSFLGTGFYQEVNYIGSNQAEEEVVPTRFIQESTILNYAIDFTKDDKIFILTTEGALINWEDNEHKNPKTEEHVFYEGLETKLTKLKLQPKPENIPIKKGSSTNELWDIFKTVYDLLEPNDKVIFDITHGFRSLPMLNMVLINYAKLLKNIEVLGVYYGAYDAEKIKSKNGKREFSPIWNLKSFVELQDWTNAANIFLNTGNALDLVKQIQDEENLELRNGLNSLSKNILVNRGLKIIEGTEIISLRNALQRIENKNLKPDETPLKPILEKIRNKFDYYKENHPINGFLAAKWAMENGLIQQAATMLEEAVITFVLFEINQEDKINISDIRLSVSAAITIGDNVDFRYTVPIKKTKNEELKDTRKREREEDLLNWQKENVPLIRALSYSNNLRSIINSIKNSIRSDINHSGFRENPRTYDEFQVSLTKRYKELRKLFIKLNKFELPHLNE